ncbi:MAG TPA: hypothetical protein VGF48_05915 [Thermoanaerobaculia bacterium]|jgi:hypothetical protein
MIERLRPPSSAEREHVARALELSRPSSRLVILVVCVGAVPYLFILICSGPLTRAGLTAGTALLVSAAAGSALGLLLLRRGLKVRAEEIAAHGLKLAQLDSGVVRELEIEAEEYWIVQDVFEEEPHAYLLRSGAKYVLLLPNRSSFEPRAEVDVDIIEPLGFVLRNESTREPVPNRGVLPYVDALFNDGDCRVLAAEELPEAWRGRVAA